MSLFKTSIVILLLSIDRLNYSFVTATTIRNFCINYTKQ